MRGDDTHVPIHYQQTPANQSKPLRRHHTARYYVQRVQDSLTTRVSKVLCSIFLSLLAIVGLIAFILWLSLRPHRPRFYIHDFSVPGLGQESGFQNAEITFFVTARNSNQRMEIEYEAMDGTVYYRDQNIGTMPLLFPFSQEPKNTTEVHGVLSGATLTVTSQRWAEFLNDRAHGSVVFRVELTSTIKFKVATWQSKTHRMHANCDVGVGPDGNILSTYKDKRCPVYFS
ncbi:NDR1/HIN1-like protein 26 [Neltuma alba]|uniref:NDR1/HIN1-like protein 26 n=1 Tax=Neltuma alba TaxID=207710 RepID=UPI0010A2C7C1|nr:NDR1/HIN1-like protein 26 [Prosopis alba]XP_028806163.1 NDR1/HIN1-like protein 26 [Prosopis alba]